MLKIKLSFCAISRNRFFNQFISVTKTNLTSIAARANRAICQYKSVLRNASLPLAKTFAAIVFASFMNANANAQCNTFKNADAANPLLSVIPKGKTIAGFAFGDIDGDGDQDVYVDFLGDRNSTRDALHLYRNMGIKTHPYFKEDKNTGFGNNKAGGQNGEMQFVDIDGDGDLDYFASDSTYSYYGQANIFYYKNVGTPKEPHFEPSTFAALPVFGTKYVQPFQFVDIDGDGDYDLYEASSYPYLFLSSYQQRIYYNIGIPQNAVFDKFIYVEEDYTLYRTYYDWNKDGFLDYFASNDYYNGRGNTQYYRHTGSVSDLTYVLDKKTGPDFQNGPLYRIVDLNNDGAPEVFDFNAHYSTLAPVAVIQDTVVMKGSRQVTLLSSQNRSTPYTYRWEYNGKTIPGATHAYVYAVKPGVYTLYVTDDCGIGVSLNDTVNKNTVQTEQGNDRLSPITNATVLPFTVKNYPNPFTNTFTLQLSGANERTESMVKITDLAGRVFLSQRMSASTVQLGQRLPAGIYNIQVWQGGELVYHTITIKQ